ANYYWALLVWIRMEMLKGLREEGKLPESYEVLFKDGYVIETWVTTDLIEKIAGKYGLRVERPAVGFSKIAELGLDEIIMPKLFGRYGVEFTDERKVAYKKSLSNLRIDLFKERYSKGVIEEILGLYRGYILGGFEESNGASLGGHILEKDGILAGVVMLEVFEFLASKGITGWQAFLKMWREFGYYATVNLPLSLKGPTAMRDRDEIMKKAEDYYNKVNRGEELVLGGKLVIKAQRGKDVAGFDEKGFKFIFEDNSWVIIRPSVTEPKIRFYGQAIVDSKEFEGRVDRDIIAIKDLEDKKLDKFVKGVIEEIEKEAKGEVVERVKVSKEEIKRPVLIFDIDGTLAERKEVLSREITEILNEFMDRGHLVVIVTGNPLDEELKKRLEGIWGKKNLILGVNISTQMFYFEEGLAREFIGYRKGIRGEDKKKIISIIQEFIKGTKEDRFDYALSLSEEDLAILKDVLREGGLNIEDRVTRIAFRYEGFKDKMSEDKAREIRQAMVSILRDILREENITGYEVIMEGKTTIATGPVGIDKNDAIGFILEHFGLMAEDAIYFGDEFIPQGNDWPVVGVGGLKIYSVGTKDNLPINVEFIGQGQQATLEKLKQIKESKESDNHLQNMGDLIHIFNAEAINELIEISKEKILVFYIAHINNELIYIGLPYGYRLDSLLAEDKYLNVKGYFRGTMVGRVDLENGELRLDPPISKEELDSYCKSKGISLKQAEVEIINDYEYLLFKFLEFINKDKPLVIGNTLRDIYKRIRGLVIPENITIDRFSRLIKLIKEGKRVEVIVSDPLGLHLKVISQIVEIVKETVVGIRYKDILVDAASTWDLIELAVKQGDRVEVIVEGEDVQADEILGEITNIIKGEGFNQDRPTMVVDLKDINRETPAFLDYKGETSVLVDVANEKKIYLDWEVGRKGYDSDSWGESYFSYVDGHVSTWYPGDWRLRERAKKYRFVGLFDNESKEIHLKSKKESKVDNEDKNVIRGYFESLGLKVIWHEPSNNKEEVNSFGMPVDPNSQALSEKQFGKNWVSEGFKVNDLEKGLEIKGLT
ncbi:MAG: HAD-IIB family hydrolase, partial [Candidatus Omnitrophica bacterium]|nr:HAD-IIB family hydrolase [Candidatus Omnitrophota bacterium]